MAKQKKNSNYVTDKTVAAATKKQEEKAKKKRDKTIKIVAISVSVTLAVIALVVGLLFALGAFDYVPEPTYDASISIEGYGTLHVQLYGHDAPKTVEHFIDLAKSGYFINKSIHTLADGLLYAGSTEADGGDKGIFGEFKNNGFENKIKIRKGVVAMARGEGADSAYGQFFIATKNKANLSNDYCAFGVVTNYEIIEQILKDCGGNITAENAPKITNITFHESHDH